LRNQIFQELASYKCVYGVLLEGNFHHCFVCLRLFLYSTTHIFILIIKFIKVLDQVDQLSHQQIQTYSCWKVPLSPLNGWEWMWKDCYQLWKPWEVHKVQEDHNTIVWEEEKDVRKIREDWWKTQLITMWRENTHTNKQHWWGNLFLK